MKLTESKIIASEEEMQQLGGVFAQLLEPKDVIYFQGELGAGKTTFIRGLLKALGHTGFVKSPTYSLIELYSLAPFQVVHLDLYRLTTPEEIQNIGLNDYLNDNAILLIEWPEKGKDFLPAATLICKIELENEKRKVQFFTL